MNWYTQVWKNGLKFSGRARRSEYWYFLLFNLIISFGLLAIDMLIIGLGEGISPLYWIYSLAAIIPSLAVTVRRLHDTGRSGWWILIGMIPLVGGIILIVFLATEGDYGDNQYGADPKHRMEMAV